MQLTRMERITLINQYRILSFLDKDSKDYYDEVIDILSNGYEIFYSQIDQWVSEDMPVSDCKFVLDVLDMYRAIFDYIKNNPKDKEVSKHVRAKFIGFDGNTETNYMGFASFLINKQGKFAEQREGKKGKDCNSHCPMVHTYTKMLEMWNSFNKSFHLSKTQVMEILESTK